MPPKRSGLRIIAEQKDIALQDSLACQPLEAPTNEARRNALLPV